MNMNEVIANRANEILGGELGKYDRVTLMTMLTMDNLLMMLSQQLEN